MSIQIGNRWGSHLAQLTREWYQRQRGAADQEGAAWEEIVEGPTITFLNDTGETVPAGGLMAITGVEAFGDGTFYLTIAKPSANSCLSYAVNGPDDVETSGTNAAGNTVGYGQCYTFGRCKAFYSGSPAVDEVWGPEPDQWYATKGFASSGWGLAVLGTIDSDADICLAQIIVDCGLLQWGKVQSGFVNVAGTAKATVSVKACDSDGAVFDPAADAFDVKTPIRKNKATALFTDYVVGYVADLAGSKIILTDCFDDPLGTVKQWDAATANIPDGWKECDGTAASAGHLARPDARGRYIAGVDGSHALDATGGNLTHAHADHTHSENAAAPWNVGRTACVQFDDHTHDAVNHEPPWLGLYNIKRTT